ncbi:hypothetical protein YERSI8AC_40044 [Enterobacterales bacterium 8AC]|nr:hypothetical protein YERSI8AC_40044 [Enterobacterales bacterium 8AC]
MTLLDNKPAGEFAANYLALRSPLSSRMEGFFDVKPQSERINEKNKPGLGPVCVMG